MDSDDNTKAIVEAIDKLRSTLFWVCFWLFAIFIAIPSSGQIIRALKEIGGKLK